MNTRFERFPDGKCCISLGHNQRLFYEPKTDTFTVEYLSEDGHLILSVPVQSTILEQLKAFTHGFLHAR